MLWTGVAFSEMGLRDRCVIPTLKQSCTVLQAPSGRLQRPGRVEAVPDAVSWPGMFQPVIFRLWLHLHSTLFPSLPCFSSLKWKSKSGHWFVFYLLKHSGHFYSVRHLSLRHLCLFAQYRALSSSWKWWGSQEGWAWECSRMGRSPSKDTGDESAQGLFAVPAWHPTTEQYLIKHYLRNVPVDLDAYS